MQDSVRHAPILALLADGAIAADSYLCRAGLCPSWGKPRSSGGALILGAKSLVPKNKAGVGIANLFVASRFARPLLFPRMLRFRFSLFAALAGLLIVFTSCERHRLGEMPELQKEHLHPLAPKGEEVDPGVPTPPVSSSPTDFFPKQQP